MTSSEKPKTPANTSETDGAGDSPANTRTGEARRHYDMALEHHRAGRLDVAIKEYAQALRFQPNSADTYNNLGVALRSAGRPEAAVACYRRSLALRNAAAGVYTNLGNALRDLGDTAKAVEAHRRAVKHGPKSPKALYNAGLAFREGGHTKVALEHFARAIKLEPTYAQCRVEHALTLLQMGEWQRGFKELEIRFAINGRDPRRKDIETWNGSALKGRTILINYEGDEGTAIQFSRFAAVLKRGGAKVVMECPPHMAHLLSASPDIEETIALGAPATNIDVQVPLLSLPARLGTTIDTIPEEVPYLNVPKVGVSTLDIHPETRLAIGMAWSGNWQGRATKGPKHHGDMVLDDMAELIGIPEIQIFSLERGAGAGDIARLGLQPLIDQAGQSVMDTGDMAAAINQLDLVICTDSVAAHVAGALGKPVWMILDSGANWSWLLEHEHSPWYPSMRIFRSQPDEPWSTTISQVRKELMAVLKGG
ncbi:MAG: tetratricopeptide repeat-containing glycosyltransferase family protein [Magnetovibrio sp.]|nr:tetratricopeptide repeat-containing glycosyltransferase family protein [Magnetovibrio sp.]